MAVDSRAIPIRRGFVGRPGPSGCICPTVKGFRAGGGRNGRGPTDRRRRRRALASPGQRKRLPVRIVHGTATAGRDGKNATRALTTRPHDH
jgi:hypothetical protein